MARKEPTVDQHFLARLSSPAFLHHFCSLPSPRTRQAFSPCSRRKPPSFPARSHSLMRSLQTSARLLISLIFSALCGCPSRRDRRHRPCTTPACVLSHRMHSGPSEMRGALVRRGKLFPLRPFVRSVVAGRSWGGPMMLSLRSSSAAYHHCRYF